MHLRIQLLLQLINCLSHFCWCFLCQVCYVCWGKCLLRRHLHIWLFEITTNVAHENNILVVIGIGGWILVKQVSSCLIWHLWIQLLISSTNGPIHKVVFFKTVVPIDFGAHQDQITVLVNRENVIYCVSGWSIKWCFIKFSFYSYSLNEVFEIHFFELQIIRCPPFNVFDLFMFFHILLCLFSFMSGKFTEMLIWHMHFSF